MFEETNVVPNVKIRVEFDSTGDEITLTGKNALNKLCQICKEHNVPFRAELFTDMLLESSPDYVEYRHKIIISDGYKMIPCKEFEMYVLKNINLIKGMIFPLLAPLVDFSDILSPKSFKESLTIRDSIVSRLNLIQEALELSVKLIKEFGKEGIGWNNVVTKIKNITTEIPSIINRIDVLDTNISCLIEKINTIFEVEV
nr:MAG TPA: hypothetical protein [Caudoviricetes sp.]